MRLGLLVDGEVRSDGQVAHAAVLDVETFLPAAGQGAVALEIRAGDEAIRALAGAINHDATFDAVTAERRFLELLGAGCETPVGVLSRLEGEELLLRAVVFEDGEAEPLQAEARGHRSDPGALVRRLVGNLSRMQS
jgi:hydroxymethylbilane synthase